MSCSPCVSPGTAKVGGLHAGNANRLMRRPLAAPTRRAPKFLPRLGEWKSSSRLPSASFERTTPLPKDVNIVPKISIHFPESRLISALWPNEREKAAAKPAPLPRLRRLSREREACPDPRIKSGDNEGGAPEGANASAAPGPPRLSEHPSRPFAFGKGRLRMRAGEETPIFRGRLCELSRFRPRRFRVVCHSSSLRFVVLRPIGASEGLAPFFESRTLFGVVCDFRAASLIARERRTLSSSSPSPRGPGKTGRLLRLSGGECAA